MLKREEYKQTSLMFSLIKISYMQAKTRSQTPLKDIKLHQCPFSCAFSKVFQPKLYSDFPFSTVLILKVYFYL
jgi:hypothetical protein